MEEYQVYLLAQNARLIDALRIRCLSGADAFTRALSSVKRLLGPGSHAEIWKDGVRLHRICIAMDASTVSGYRSASISCTPKPGADVTSGNAVFLHSGSVEFSQVQP